MSSEDMQNNPSSLDETYHSNQSVAAAELTNVSVECSDNMPFECNEPPEAGLFFFLSFFCCINN